MFKVLVATDGSIHALKGAEYAARMMAKMNDVMVTLLYVGQSSETVFPFLDTGRGMVDQDALTQAVNEIGNSVLANTAKAFSATTAKVETRVLVGEAANVISKIANEEKYDLVILGSRGLTDLQGIVVGSVSERVAHQTRVPVLIVR